MNRFIRAVSGPRNSVIYTDDKDQQFQFSGGARTWRNNNPGNLVSGNVSCRNNQIGTAGGFAVFPDYNTGHEAWIDCLKTTYSLSKDNTSWHYWNGSAWSLANGMAGQANLATVINTNISEFPNQVGTGTLYFKAFLKSTGTSTCSISMIAVGGTK